MKKILLCLVLGFGLALMCSTSSFALTVHDAIYHWQEGGTIVTQSSPLYTFWKVGNPVGWNGGTIDTTVDKIQVHEKAFSDGVFIWTVTNDNYSDLYSFHVANVGISNIVSTNVPTGWSFSYDRNWLTWTTTSNKIGLHGVNTFTVQTNGTGKYEISTAAVDLDVTHQNWQNGGGFWVASHPVPEPATLSLIMGMGLIGFIGRGIRKRFIA